MPAVERCGALLNRSSRGGNSTRLRADRSLRKPADQANLRRFSDKMNTLDRL
jgi:hypothetical protein